MRLIERIGSERLPIAPYLLEHLWIVTILYTTINELWLHRIDDILFLLTHRLTQRIALTTGKIGQETREQHHLLLINRNTIGILQVFLHHGDIISDGLITMLTTDKLRDIAHRTGAIKGVHGNKILKDCGFQFTKILTHTVGLKLESADGTSLLIKLISLGVVDGNRVQIYFNTTGTLDILTSLLQLRECLQAQEVHLDKSRRFYHVTIILSTVSLNPLEIRIVGSRHWHMVTNRITTDNKATGMNTRSPNGTLQHLGIFNRVRQMDIRGSLSLLQFGYIFDGIRQIHFRSLTVRAIGQTIWYCLAQTV